MQNSFCGSQIYQPCFGRDGRRHALSVGAHIHQSPDRRTLQRPARCTYSSQAPGMAVCCVGPHGLHPAGLGCFALFAVQSCCRPRSRGGVSGIGRLSGVLAHLFVGSPLRFADLAKLSGQNRGVDVWMIAQWLAMSCQVLSYFAKSCSDLHGLAPNGIELALMQAA